MPDPAEVETEQRRSAGPASFDRLVEAVLGLTTANVQLVKTMRIGLLFGALIMVFLMSWSVFTLYSMRGELVEIRTLIQRLFDHLPNSHS